jgi:hypothetical protein
MINLAIDETSGVDHPAHLHEGWMVIKAANPAEVDEIINELAKSEDLPDTVSVDVGDEEDSVSQDETVNAEVIVEDETEALKARIVELEDRLAKSESDPEDEAVAEESEEEILKSAPEAVRNMLESIKKSADEAQLRAEIAESELAKSRDAVADAEAIEKAKSWGHLSIDAEVVGKSIRQLAAIDSDLAKSVEDILSSVNAQAESANIFAEIGKSAAPTEHSAYDRMLAMAKAAVSDGKASTFEQAFADVTVSNPDLYSQYMTEKGA